MSNSGPSADATGQPAGDTQSRGRRGLHRIWALVTRYWIDAIPTVIALALAWREYRKYRLDPLFPDTQGFVQLANSFPHDSIWGGFREPVWATLLAGPLAVLGHDRVTVKLLSIAGFVFLVLAVQLTVRWFHGRIVGLIGGIFIAASPYLVYWSVSGLREETAAATIIVFGVLVCRKPATRSAWLWLAGYVGLLAMFRWDSTTLTIPVMIVAFIILRVDWKTIVLSAVIVLAIVSPLVIGNAVRNDDPLYQSNAAAHFYRNYEFGGTPGFPSKKALAKNSFLGPRETWVQYIFERHTIGTVVHRAIEAPVVDSLEMAGLGLFGFEALPVPDATWPTIGVLGDNKQWMPWMMFAGGILGAIVLIRRGRWPFAMLLGLSTVAHFPVVHLYGYDYRLEITVYPLLLIANIEAVMWLIDHVRDRRAGIGARTEGAAS